MGGSVTDFISPLRYFTFVCSALSLLIVVYLLYALNKSRAKLRYDIHYQLRLCLLLILLINKIWQLVYLVKGLEAASAGYAYSKVLDQYLKNSTFENALLVDEFLVVNTQTGLQFSVHYYILFTSFCLVMYFIVLLAIDRFERVKSTTVFMIQQRRPLFILVRIILLVWYLVAFVLYGLEYVTSQLLEYGDYMNRISGIASYRNVIMFPLMLSSIFFYYTLTIRMVYLCVLINKEHRQLLFKSFGPLWWKWMTRKPKQDTPSHTIQTDPISPHRLEIAVKIITYFVLLFLTDCIIIAVFTWINLTYAQNIVDFDDLFAFGQTWLSIHVACAFKLLDLFVGECTAPWSLPGFVSNEQNVN